MNLSSFAQVKQSQLCCRTGEGEAGAWVTNLCLWALNPALAFREVTAAARCVVLTSGTLAPMESFASEVRPLLPLDLFSTCSRMAVTHLYMSNCTLDLEHELGEGAAANYV